MSIFSSLKSYAGKWSEKSSRAFTQEEINEVESATIVESNFGYSVCFFMKSGVQHYIPTELGWEVTVGQVLDLTKLKIKVLCKRGEEDILRIGVL